MSVQISRETIKKLTHESAEIRLRALEQVETKLQRSLAHKEPIDFKPGDLCKQLIRWFGYKPLQEPLKALQILLRIFRSNYGDEAISQIGLERLLRELGKVQQLVKARTEESLVVEQIIQVLHVRKQDDDLEEIVKSMDNLNARESESNVVQIGGSIELPENDFETPWSKPTMIDFNSIKFFADVLANPFANAEELQNALQHLKITMVDYPVEYLLQAPHVYLSLLQLLDKADEVKCPLDDITNALLVFLKCLKERLSMRRKSLALCAPQDDEESGKTQLKLERVLQLLLEKCLNQLQMQILEFFDESTKIFEILLGVMEIYEMQHLCIEGGVVLKLAKMSCQLKERCEKDANFRLLRIKYLLVSFLMQDILEQNARKSMFVNLQMLEPLLSDYTMMINFPQRYERLKAMLLNNDGTLEKKFLALEKYEGAFCSALSLIKSPDCMQSVDIIQQSGNLCVALEKLKSLKLVEILFNAIIVCNPLYAANSELKQQAADLLLKLVQLRHKSLKTFVCAKITEAVKKHFACLMNGECYSSGVTNSQLLSAHVIGVPLSSSLLMQFVNESYESDSREIKQCCESVLIFLLKAQHLLGAHWVTFLEILEPVLPLLQCATDSCKLVELLVKLFDPDTGNLSFLAVLKGNLVFLFHPCALVRGEALTRLIFMLNSLVNAGEYLPNVMEIKDIIPSDICLLQVPRDFSRLFTCSDIFNERGALINLLTMLDTCDIDPLIRKSTLMQVNVMCTNWQMLSAFCKEHAYYLVMQALENSMRKCSYADYTDAAAPAVGILSKVLYYDAELRRELTEIPNIYVLLLRALFQYLNDTHVQQDAVLCLFQLLFANFLLTSESNAELPSIVSNLQLPLRCELKCIFQKTACSHEYENIFPDVGTETTFLRHFIASSLSGGYSKVSQKYLDIQKQYDFNIALHLTQQDLHMMRFSSPTHNLRRYLKAIANSTEYRTLVNVLSMIKLQLLLNDYDAKISEETATDLFILLNKYLQMQPGTESDYLVYEHLLELYTVCLRLKLRPIIAGLSKSLQQDYQHVFMAIIQNGELPLQLHYKVCLVIALLLNSPDSFKTPKLSASVCYSKLFEFCFTKASQYFERRELPRVRCLLQLIQLLSGVYLNMSDQKLFHYCNRLLKLSVALKSITQTGAQWQRDCLLAVSQLAGQMEAAQTVFKLNAVSLKYLSGLGGHSDAQVRALTWCIFAKFADYKDQDTVGTTELINVLSYLPGGFMACCLSTFMDVGELILVRHLAGNMFVLLISPDVGYETATVLLDQHGFYRTANEALRTCVFQQILPLHFERGTAADVVSCEIVSCYTRICTKVIGLERDFIKELCEKPFMFRLYELLKLPPEHDNPAYYAMCADICQLYASIYMVDFLFLQRTLCRDSVWLASFLQLLDQPQAEEVAVVNVLQLLLVLSKDYTAYEQFCEKIANTPEFIMKLFMRAINVAHINTPLQRSTLSLLTMLLIKSQDELKNGQKNFVAILEEPFEIEQNDSSNAKTAPTLEKTKEQNSARSITTNRSLKAAIRKLDLQKNLNSARSQCENGKMSDEACRSVGSGAEIVFIELLHLFNHVYHSESCKFDSAPSSTKVQICETLSVLLKLSPLAQATAKDLKLLDKILRIFKTFLDEIDISCTTFMRRYSTSKSTAVIKNFRLLFNVLLNWFSAPPATVSEELQAVELVKILIQIWPWMAHSSELKLLVLEMCAFLSERSFIVCQQFSTTISSFAHSILSLVHNIVVFETQKIKAQSSDSFPVISNGLRILMNCCSCTDGRVMLVKFRIIDIFDNLYPFRMKAPKNKVEVLHAWLQFWELFSRYPEGAVSRYLRSLCSVINRSPARCVTRLLSLKILRNVSFLPSNRASLLGSTEFIFTVNDIISQQVERIESYEEQMLISVAIWTLVSSGAKYVAWLRGTKLAKQFRVLREHLTAMEEEDAVKMKELPFAQDLGIVLDVILAILNDN